MKGLNSQPIECNASSSGVNAFTNQIDGVCHLGADIGHRGCGLRYPRRELVEKEIDRLESSGLLYQVNNSEWASPTVNVPELKRTIFSANGIQSIQNKVEAISKAPLPANLTEHQRFLGAEQYYASLASSTKPAEVFEWSLDSACKELFK
ncbi:hypothetical protein LSH36_1163g00001 [Paralvinella palmiformis]|uniref:Uncharacterized protein n=1 Tax=Paralvinella palmiformis TaxID=53620 RepID=A0AAD9MRF5_9ANNE|nr:hypothetical protein LSH36_1163g00001 [Paralvinella palmiformis]